MNRRRTFHQNGQPLRRQATSHAFVLLGIDNLAALEDLFGESMKDEIVEAVLARIAPVLPSRAEVRRSEHRRIVLSIPQLDRIGVSTLVAQLQATIAQQAIPTSQGPVAVTLAAGCVLGDGHRSEAEEPSATNFAKEL